MGRRKKQTNSTWLVTHGKQRNLKGEARMKREFLENLKLDKEIIDQIMAENGKDIQAHQEKYSDYEKIKTNYKSLESENAALKATMEETTKASQGYEQSINELNAKISGYETSNLKTKIALQYGIPYDLAGRLVGEDENSITEDAKKLAELVKSSDPVPPLKTTEPQGAKDDGYKSLLQNLNFEGD